MTFWFCWILMLHSIQYVTPYCWTDYIGGLSFLALHLTGLNLTTQNVPRLFTWVLIDLRLCHCDRVSLRARCWVLFCLVSISCFLGRLSRSMAWPIIVMQTTDLYWHSSALSACLLEIKVWMTHNFLKLFY